MELVEVTSSSSLRTFPWVGMSERADDLRAVATTRPEVWATSWARAWPIPDEQPVTEHLQHQ